MKALLLAAGLGTRLRPLTESIPKCLVEVGDEILLGNWLRRLVAARVERVLVNLHYLPDQVVNWVNGSPFAEIVDFVYEDQLLGTAGTIGANSTFFDGEDGLVIHCDNYCTFDISTFMSEHGKRPQKALMSLVGFRTTEPEQCGVMHVDEKMLMTGYWEKSAESHGDLANGGIYLLSEEIRNACNGHTDFAGEVLPGLCGHVFVWEQSGPFFDIGTPERLELARSAAINQQSVSH